MAKRLVVGVCACAVLAAAWIFWPKPEDRGQVRYFADQTYNFQAIRVLNDVAVAGGDTEEAAQAIAGLKAGDAVGWYAAWKAAGDRAVMLASHTADKLNRGSALLRAHVYYRTAEFFLSPHDAKRPAVWKENVDSFYSGLQELGVPYQRIAVPYAQHRLNAIYYPGPSGAAARPLLVVVGGYDSTMEELYFTVGAAALRHGYSVLAYEGPGQGSVIRDQALTFQPDWEKPNGAVLDTFLATHRKPAKIILLGVSLGGYLAPRAAAFDARIDGVVAYDVFYDGYAVASRNVPEFAFWLHRHGYTRTLDFLNGIAKNPGTEWAQENGKWVFGQQDPFALLQAFKAYGLASVAARIKADVLIFSGSDDHFVPADQVALFQKSLTNARSVTSVRFDRASGGSEHCQLGAPSLWQGALFDWLQSKFPSAPSTSA